MNLSHLCDFNAPAAAQATVSSPGPAAKAEADMFQKVVENPKS